MNKIWLINGCLLLMLIIVLNACTKADLQYGSQLVGDQYSDLVMTDTFTTDVSTIYLDSFITSASGTALLGSYYDEAFGQITASSYFQLSPPTFADRADNNLLFDSIELVMKRNGKWYGDSTQPLQVNVYQLSQIVNKTSSTNWYNFDTVTHDPSPLGSKTFLVYPNITDTISIRLSDALGKQFLNLLQSGDDEVSTADNFVNYFNGICIIPQEAKGAIYGWKDSVEIRLHYKETSGVIAVDKVVSFSLYNNERQFNHIAVNRSGTALAQLNSQNNSLPSLLTNSAGYMQSSTGSLVKIRIPNIRNILQIPNYLKLERATLTIKPVAGTYQGYYTLPDSLRLTSTDKNNEIGYDVAYTDGSVEYGLFNRDYLYEQNTSYTYDITSYLTSQISVVEANENGLLLRPPAEASNTSFERVIVGDALNKTSRIQLQLYYLTVK